MASTYTTNLQIQQIGTGDQAGSWGNTTNTNLGLIEQAISGYASVSCTGATDALGSMTPGSSATARNMYLRLYNAGGGTLVVPTNVKLYFIYNNTSPSAGSVTIRPGTGAVPSGPGITVPAGKRMVLFCDGSSVVDAIDYISQTAFTSAITTTGITNTGVIDTDVLKLTLGSTGTPFAVMSTATAATATSCSIAGTALTVGGTVTGTFAIGQYVTGTGIADGTVITAGTASPYTVNISQTVTGPVSITGTPMLTWMDLATAAWYFSGPLTATTLTVNGSTIPANGVYLPSTNTLGFSTNTVQRMTIGSSGVVNNVAPTLVASATGSSISTTTFTVGTLVGTTLFATGQLIYGTGVAQGTVLGTLLTGTGGTGSTFTVNISQTVASTTISSYVNSPTQTVNGIAGIHSHKIADATGTNYNTGFLEVPQTAVSTSVNYTAILSDSGKHIYYTGSTAATASNCSSSSTTLTVGGTITGTFAPGQPLSNTSGTGTFAANTYILNQLTGTTGGAGTYTLSAAPTVALVSPAVIAANPVLTIPANAAVPYPIGTVLTFFNDASSAVTAGIAINSDTLVWAGTSGPSTGTRILPRYSFATATKVTNTRWFISGTGLI